MTPGSNEDQSDRMIEKVINSEHLFGMHIVFLVIIRIMLIITLLNKKLTF